VGRAVGVSLPTGTVTFLFTDIEGSTRLLAALGDRYASLLDTHDRILRSAIAAHGGTEVNTEGDAFFAAFPSAVEALGAAADAQRALGAADWPDGAAVRVRIGLHSGEGRLGGENYVGLDVHRAARIAAAGHGGQVLLSDATRALVAASLPEGVRIRDLGDHRLKDLEAPIRIAQLEIEGLEVEFPALKTLDLRPGNLPGQLTTFIGRDRELRQLIQLFETHRLVTLTGTGGTGKTRLALQAAAQITGEFRDGAFFVDLAPTRDAALVPLAVAHTLRLNVDPGGDALSALRSHLRDRELLLVLDNFEQVAEAAGMVTDLLSIADGLRVLVTSRMPLGIYGEQEFDVPPLDVPAADLPLEELHGQASVDLFLDRARAVVPEFTLSVDSAPAIAGIIGRVDGLPLAIELAASQVRLLPPAAILSRLDQHLPLPSGPSGGRPERQRTVEAAIGWSYELLEEPERRLCARLSVFPGGCSLESAEAVCDPGDLGVPVLDGLAALVTKSLLRQLGGAGDDEPRFGMLETILDYAAERLRADFDADATHRRLAEFLLAFTEEARPHLTMADQVPWLDRCERERANLRRALSWAIDAGEATLGLRMATALWRFWHLRGPMREGRQTLEQLLALPGSPDAVRGKALSAAGGLAWWSGDYAAMRQHYEEALPLVQQGGDRPAEMDALYDLGFAELWSGVLTGGVDLDRAERYFAQSLSLAEELGDRRGIGRALRGGGMVRGIARNDPTGALPVLEQAATLLEEIGERWDLIEALIALGNAHRFSGAGERAKDHYLRGIDLSAVAGSRNNTIGLLFLLTALESQMGRHQRVARLWGAAQAAHEAIGAIRPPAAQRLIGDPVAAARQAIGDEAVERGLAEGRQMDYETMLDYAHVDTDEVPS
jgi:predicted ATPase/class 3 adenylate cyclase